jgi:hypothetical protein
MAPQDDSDWAGSRSTPRACSRIIGNSVIAVSMLLAGTLLGACGADAQPRRAERLAGVSPEYCLAVVASGGSADPARCPEPLRAELERANATCRDVGGTLTGFAEGDVWSLDVDGDGSAEIAFELEGNVACADAASVFSCGSLGCEKTLYRLSDATWRAIGSFRAAVPEDVALAATPAGSGYAPLEICARDSCAERWIHEWRGEAYEATRIDVRGARVAFAESVHGLYPLRVAATLLAAPAQGAAAIERYDAGTEVAVVGTAEGGDFYYVSPCNACESGFVAASAVAVP